LIIQCENCQTRYHYDEARFGTALVKKIRCTKCASVFEIRNPNAPEGHGPILLADDFTLDPTEMAAERRRKPIPSQPPVPPPLPREVQQAGADGGHARTKSSVEDLMATLRGGAIPPPPPPPHRVPAARREDPNQSTGEFPPVGISADRPLKLPDWYRLSLACISGPDSGRIFEIDKPKVTIGRANADVILSDTQCSRQHAVIEVMDDEAFIVDLGSTNGTFIGDKRIARHALDNRAEFDVGTTTLMFIKTRKD
jgi:predicted Zn finger-like uncharacterized protein